MLYTFRRGRVMATGIRPDAKVAVRAGLKYIMFNANYPEDQLLKIDAYLQSLEPEPSPLLVDGRLSESAMRGRALFNGEAGCAKCHAGELKGKDTLIYNYTQTGNESRGLLVPPLVEAWRTAPYLCDGRAATVKEVLTTYNPGYAKGNGKHGDVNGLSDSQIDDVCSYVMSLSTEAEALTLDRSSMDFGTAKEGYTSWGAMTATLTNNGAAAVTGLALKAELQSFELKLEKTELAEGKSAVVTVTPKPDLPIGLYRETAVIDSASHDSVIVQLTFLVNGEIPLVGSAVVGETLSIGEMTEPTGLKYQWYRGADTQSASPIGGAQERTYVPTLADEGLCLLVKASLDGRILYTSELSEPVRLSGQTTYLRVDGIPKPGQTLTASVRGSSKTYDITWTSGGETLGTGTTYEVTENDVGLVIVATAVCREDGSKLTYRLSAVAPASQAVVSVRVADGSGNALAGCQLSLSTAPDEVLAVTRGDGTAELLLGEGTYTVLAKKESASAEALITITSEEILAGKAELPMTINRGDAYAVTGSFSCAGVYGAKVELIDQAGTVTGLADLRRQKETSFRLEVPAGTYTLRITKPGHLSCTIRRISVTGDLKIPTVLPLTPGKARPGDSARISFFDLAAMSGAFAGLFRLTDNPDIDGDGMFTAADLGYVRQNYGKTAIDMTYEELIDQGLKP